MADQKKHHDTSGDLRRTAEEEALKRSARSTKIPDDMSPGAMQRIIHELQVHQIELEMQNEELLRTQVELNNTKARYFYLYEQAPVGYCTLTQRGLITEANLTLASMLGLSREGLVGCPLSKFILSDDQDLLYLHLRHLSDTLSLQKVELRMVQKDGTVLWILLTSTVARDETNTPIYFVVLSDITDSKQADKAKLEYEAQFRSYIDNCPIGVFIMDVSSKIMKVNPAASKLMGYTQQEFLELSMVDLLSAESQEHGRRAIKQAAEKGHSLVELGYERKTGEVGCMSVEAVRHSPTQVLGFASDITARKKDEDALRESEERFSTAFHLMPMGADITTLSDGRFLAVNKYFVEIFGYAENDLLGHTSEEVGIWVNPEDRAHVAAMIGTGQSVHAYEVQIRRKDGSLGWVSYSGHQVMLKGVLCLLSGAVDITQRILAEQTLHESEKRYRSLFNNAEVGMFRSRLDGSEIIDCNDKFLQIVGKTRENVIGFPSLFLWADLDTREAMVRQLNKNGRVSDFEFEILNAKDEVRQCLTSLKLFREDDLLEGSILDITERKQMEEELKKEAVRKDGFIALLGHELRNPLVPIGNAVYLIQKAGENLELIKAACAIVSRQVTHMSRLVDDLLDVSRISKGKIQLKMEEIDLVETIRNVIADFQPTLNEHNLTLEANLPAELVQIVVDKPRIIQVVSNLLQNAIKFTDEGGHIDISVRIDKPDWTVISIRDTGSGIPCEQFTSIFEPFVQGKETLGRSRGGLGLGLAMVKGMVQLHGGTVSVQSDGPGKGSEFTIQLPLPKVITKPLPPTPPAVNIKCIRPRRILIVEDIIDASLTLKLLLQLAGHLVEVAHDGTAALEKANCFDPEIILCDICLPGSLDGYDVARRISETSRSEAVYLIGMTGLGLPEAKDKAMQAGFDSLLIKPVEPDSLLLMISHIFNAVNH